MASLSPGAKDNPAGRGGDQGFGEVEVSSGVQEGRLMSNVSKYAQISVKRLPRQKQTLPLWGANEDTGKYFRCWNCGFICNRERDQVGLGSGVNVLDFPGYNPDLQTGTEQGIAILEDNHVCMRNGPDNLPDSVQRHDHYPDVVAGCPFCGTKNWK